MLIKCKSCNYKKCACHDCKINNTCDDREDCNLNSCIKSCNDHCGLKPYDMYIFNISKKEKSTFFDEKKHMLVITHEEFWNDRDCIYDNLYSSDFINKLLTKLNLYEICENTWVLKDNNLVEVKKELLKTGKFKEDPEFSKFLEEDE